MVKRLALTALLLLMAVPALAASPVDLTVYQNGTVLVREVRGFELHKGTGEIAVMGLPRSLRPGTLSAESVTAPKLFRVLSSQFRSGGLSSTQILQRHIGKMVQVVLPDTRDTDSRRVAEARLLGVEGARALLELEDGRMWIGPYEAVMLEQAPADAVLSPVMAWRFRNTGPKRQDVALSYLADGMDWNADMVLTRRGHDQWGLKVWATMRNESGRDFKNARLRLVAGEVSSGAPKPMPRNMLKAEVMVMDAAPGGASRSEFGQWHLYDVGEGFSLPQGAVTQVLLFEVPDMPVQRRLLAESNVGVSPRSGTDRRPLEVRLEIDNKDSDQPMPAGTVRVFEPGPEGTPLFAGEDAVPGVPEGGRAVLRLGRAFDVTMERRQTDFSRSGKHRLIVAYELTLRNAREKTAAVRIRERIPGQWKLLSASAEGRREDAGTLVFDLDVPKKDNLTLTYKVQVELK
ncbi:DUF4139 domain-containing protein [Desulfovibrio oxyclinae]|uniref:DUF4139 domain-containing protein n=1 Tax=Desulfovibrio oxyclinae TaxID=63560 RepID=UPI00037057E3|nr:hypothetical protein [Desulfovibrio oxyclinae]